MAEHKVTTNPYLASKLLKSYVIGFVLSVVLVMCAYFITLKNTLAPSQFFIVITVLLLAQLLVQILFYLRLNTKTQDDRWNLICFIFTLIVMAIIVSGSLWIMYNLNYYMVN